jgi:hypothetical protein
MSCPGASAIRVKVGQAIQSTIQWTNTGSQAYSFDIIVIIGDYDPSSGNISNGYIIGQALDQSASPGQSVTTTMVSGAIPSVAARAAPYDLVVLICDWDSAARQPTYTYAGCYSLDIVTITS